MRKHGSKTLPAFSVNLEEGTFSLQVFLDSEWFDPRVTVRVPPEYGKKSWVPVTDDLDLWSPRVQMYNAKVETEVKQSYFRAGFSFGRFFGGFWTLLHASTMSQDDPRYSRLLADFSSVGAKLIFTYTVRFLEKRDL